VVADLHAEGIVVEAGEISAAGAQIAGRLNLHGARLGGASGIPVLVADGAVIGTDLILSKTEIHGEVRVRTAASAVASSCGRP
jgi:hypothetical protein